MFTIPTLSTFPYSVLSIRSQRGEKIKKFETPENTPAFLTDQTENKTPKLTN